MSQFHKQFDDFCDNIDMLEKMVEDVKANLDDVEKQLEIADEELDIPEKKLDIVLNTLNIFAKPKTYQTNLNSEGIYEPPEIFTASDYFQPIPESEK